MKKKIVKIKKFHIPKHKEKLHKLWSLAIRGQEAFACQWCLFKGAYNVNKMNHAHHIVSQGICGPEGRFDLRNGMTLCWKCHIDDIKSYPDEYCIFRDYYLAQKNLDYHELRAEFHQHPIKFTEEFYNEKRKEFNYIIDIVQMI